MTSPMLIPSAEREQERDRLIARLRAELVETKLELQRTRDHLERALQIAP